MGAIRHMSRLKEIIRGSGVPSPETERDAFPNAMQVWNWHLSDNVSFTRQLDISQPSQVRQVSPIQCQALCLGLACRVHITSFICSKKWKLHLPVTTIKNPRESWLTVGTTKQQAEWGLQVTEFYKEVQPLPITRCIQHGFPTSRCLTATTSYPQSWSSDS